MGQTSSSEASPVHRDAEVAKLVCKNLLALEDSIEYQSGLSFENRQVVDTVLRAFNVVSGNWSDVQKCKFILERVDTLLADLATFQKLERASPQLSHSSIKRLLKGLLFLGASMQVAQVCGQEIPGVQEPQCSLQLELGNPNVPVFAQPSARYFVQGDIIPDVRAFGHDPAIYANAKAALEVYKGTQVEPVVTFVLGGAGAGKGYTLKHVVGKQYPEITKGMEGAVVLNTDNIMDSLPGYSTLSSLGDLQPLLHYGTYHESGDLSVPVTHLHAADVYHEPAEEINERLQSELLAERRSFVFDGTGNTLSSLARRIQRAKSAGYKVNVVVVFAEADIRWDRARERAVKSGRYVPQEIVKKGHNPPVWDEFLEQQKRAGMIDKAVFRYSE